MTKEAICLGGPRHCQIIEVGDFQPEYKFAKKKDAPILEHANIRNTEIQVCFQAERYLRKRVCCNGVDFNIYCWEFLTSEEIDSLLKEPEVEAFLKEKNT